MLGRALCLLFVVACAGCDACGREAAELEAQDEIAMPPLPEDVPQPGAVYRDAHDNAKRDLTMDNAHDRLDDIERQVLRELEALE